MHTIVSLIRESCEQYGAKAALRHKVSEVWQEISYVSLRSQTDRVAAGLLREGFRPGDHAAVIAASSPGWVASYLGILASGGVAVPVDKELKSAEIRHILADSDVRAVFCDPLRLDTVLELSGGIPSLQIIIAISPSIADQERDTAAILDACDAPLPEVHRRPEDTAVILYTSGTTGLSKGAMLSHANIVSNIRAAVAHFDLNSSIHTLSFLPINHVFEQVCGILLPLALGGTVTFCESLKKLGENLAEVKPTFFLAVPAVYRMVLDRVMKNIHATSLSRFLFAFPLTRPLVTAKVRRTFGAGTIFISGAAALDPDIVRGMTRLGLSICQGYGITETSPIISAEQPGRKRPGTVGQVLQGIEVRIDNPDEEGVGEIMVRGPNVMQGYYRNPQATLEVLAEGWYRTGDLGLLDRDGFLAIRGRLKNLIVTPNGKNVYPEEIEHELLKSPLIAEAMVYGHKSGTTEEVHAVIYPDQEALDNHCSGRGTCPMDSADVEALLKDSVLSACSGLAGYKRVRRFTIREDEFPKTTTRKIKRYEVEAGISARN